MTLKRLLEPHLTRLKTVVGLLVRGDAAVKAAFLDDHLIRRKFILSRTSEFFKQDKFTPAPLLNKALLDVGCGNTVMAQELSFRGADVLGIDPDQSLVFEAQKTAERIGSPAVFVATTAERLVAEGKTYDVVLCLDVFQDTPKVEQLIWACSKLLKDDGILIFSTANHTLRAWFFQIFLAERWFGWLPNGTQKFSQFIRPTELQRLFNRYKLTCDKVVGFYFGPKDKEWFKTPSLSVRYMGVAYRTPTRKTQAS